VTTHDFLVAGVGSRFGARLGELRDLGYVIDQHRLPLPTRGSRYRLLGEPETHTHRGSGNEDRGGPRESRRAVSTMSGPALGADVTQQSTSGAGQVPGRQHGPIRNPATDAVPPSASRAGGVPSGVERTVVSTCPSLAVGDDGALSPGLLFDPDAYGECAA
jgi:hypothetical protein